MKIFYYQLVKLREISSPTLEFCRQNKYCEDMYFILSRIRISLVLK